MAKLGLFYLGVGESSTIDFIRGGGATDGAIGFRSAGTERMRIRADGSRWTDANTLPAFECRAWVNFNGTGTVAIRASGNVSSITDNGTGNYTVNFTTAMPDADYAYAFGENDFTLGNATSLTGDTRSTTAFQVRTYNSSGTAVDRSTVTVTIFR
jgi:hypothetical protein